MDLRVMLEEASPEGTIMSKRMKNYITSDMEMLEVANTVIGEVEEEIKKMLSYLWVCCYSKFVKNDFYYILFIYLFILYLLIN